MTSALVGTSSGYAARVRSRFARRPRADALAVLDRVCDELLLSPTSDALVRRRRATDVAVVPLAPAGGALSAFAKLAFTERARAGLRRERRALALVGERHSSGQVTTLLPRVLAAGETGGFGYLVTGALPGRDPTPRLFDPAGRARTQAAALAAVAPLHRETGTEARVTCELADAWLQPGLRLLARVLMRPAPRRRSLRHLADRMRSGLAGRTLVVGWIHGDYWPGNVLVSDEDDGVVTGIVDWDLAGEREPVALDVLHTFLYTEALVTRRPVGEVVRDVLRGRRPWSDDERRALAEVAPPEGDDPLAALVLLCWLRHVGANLAQSARYARNPVWMRQNVHRVLATIERVAP